MKVNSGAIGQGQPPERLLRRIPPDLADFIPIHLHVENDQRRIEAAECWGASMNSVKDAMNTRQN